MTNYNDVISWFWVLLFVLGLGLLALQMRSWWDEWSRQDELIERTRRDK